MLIMHGEIDRHVPAMISENFYNRLVEAGYGRSDRLLSNVNNLN